MGGLLPPEDALAAAHSMIKPLSLGASEAALQPPRLTWAAKRLGKPGRNEKGPPS
jgi:hypothetical protein